VEPKPLFPTPRNTTATVYRCIGDAVLNLIYPESCLICSAPVARQQDCGVCDSCWAKALKLEIVRPWCPSCGIPFQTFDPGPEHLCSECSRETPPFSGARSFGYYRAELSRLVQGLKFEGRKNLSGLLSPLMAQAFVNSWDHRQIDQIVPVPLHPKRRRERGFNQAAVLARGLARLIGLPCCEQALRRVSATLPQVGLTDAERVKNVRGAFHCGKPDLVAAKRILLIDDVMTTGATVRSACEGLLEGGALRVSVLTLARAVPGIE
jgi:ComF family protein